MKTSRLTIPQTEAANEQHHRSILALARSVDARLKREEEHVRDAMRLRSCCLEWGYDCPHHISTQVEQALRLPERLLIIQKRRALVARAYEENS